MNEKCICHGAQAASYKKAEREGCFIHYRPCSVQSAQTDSLPHIYYRICSHDLTCILPILKGRSWCPVLEIWARQHNKAIAETGKIPFCRYPYMFFHTLLPGGIVSSGYNMCPKQKRCQNSGKGPRGKLESKEAGVE